MAGGQCLLCALGSKPHQLAAILLPHILEQSAWNARQCQISAESKPPQRDPDSQLRATASGCRLIFFPLHLSYPQSQPFVGEVLCPPPRPPPPHGAGDWCLIAMYEVQSHKFGARNSTVAARNGCRKWRNRISKRVKIGQKKPFFGWVGCLGCLWRRPFTLKHGLLLGACADSHVNKYVIAEK